MATMDSADCDRPASPGEIAAMQALLAEALDSGAVGMSKSTKRRQFSHIPTRGSCPNFLKMDAVFAGTGLAYAPSAAAPPV